VLRLEASRLRPFKAFLTLLGLAISIPWAMCSWQSWKVIGRLTQASALFTDDEVEKMVQSVLFRPGWKRPTDLLAILLPRVFMVAWALAFAAHARLLWIEHFSK
jgi:hypothetical protein